MLIHSLAPLHSSDCSPDCDACSIDMGISMKTIKNPSNICTHQDVCHEWSQDQAAELDMPDVMAIDTMLKHCLSPNACFIEILHTTNILDPRCNYNNQHSESIYWSTFKIES